MDLPRQMLQLGVVWQPQQYQPPDVSPLLAVAAVAAAAAAAVVAADVAMRAVAVCDAGASEGVLVAVAIAAETAEGVAGWRGGAGVCYPDWSEGGDAWGEASLGEVYSAEAGSSQGVVAWVGYPWVGGARDGLEVEHPLGRAAALVGVSCQEGVLALPAGVPGAACLGAYLLQDH